MKRLADLLDFVPFLSGPIAPVALSCVRTMR